MTVTAAAAVGAYPRHLGSGRLDAAAAVLWLLVSLFIGQGYVYGFGEQQQQQQQQQQKQPDLMSPLNNQLNEMTGQPLGLKPNQQMPQQQNNNAVPQGMNNNNPPTMQEPTMPSTMQGQSMLPNSSPQNMQNIGAPGQQPQLNPPNSGQGPVNLFNNQQPGQNFAPARMSQDQNSRQPQGQNGSPSSQYPQPMVQAQMPTAPFQPQQQFPTNYPAYSPFSNQITQPLLPYMSQNYGTTQPTSYSNFYQNPNNMGYPAGGNNLLMQIPGQQTNAVPTSSSGNDNIAQQLQQMPQSLLKMIPIENVLSTLNPISYAQQGMGMVTSTLGKATDYATGVKNSVGGAVVDVSKKVVDSEQSLLNGAVSMLTAFPNILVELKQKGIDILQHVLDLPLSGNKSSVGPNTDNNLPNTAANSPMTPSQANMVNELIKYYLPQVIAQQNGNGNFQPPQMQKPPYAQGQMQPPPYTLAQMQQPPYAQAQMQQPPYAQAQMQSPGGYPFQAQQPQMQQQPQNTGQSPRQLQEEPWTLNPINRPQPIVAYGM